MFFLFDGAQNDIVSSCSIFNQCPMRFDSMLTIFGTNATQEIYKENQLIDFLYLKIETIPGYVEFMRFEVYFVSLPAKNSLSATSFSYTIVENDDLKS